MSSYIFYTTEGFTEDNAASLVENCQILGWANGFNSRNAFKNFMAENLYLKEMNFKEIKCQELANNNIYYFSLKKNKV